MRSQMLDSKLLHEFLYLFLTTRRGPRWHHYPLVLGSLHYLAISITSVCIPGYVDFQTAVLLSKLQLPDVLGARPFTSLWSHHFLQLLGVFEYEVHLLYWHITPHKQFSGRSTGVWAIFVRSLADDNGPQITRYGSWHSQFLFFCIHVGACLARCVMSSARDIKFGTLL